MGGLLKGVDFERTPRGKIEDDYVGVAACGFFDLLQDCSTFGIVRSSAARQYKLAVNVFLSQLVGSYQAHRIFEAVKPRHLGHERPGAVDSELVTHLLHHGVVEMLVFFRKRIDRGINRDIAGLEAGG